MSYGFASDTRSSPRGLTRILGRRVGPLRSTPRYQVSSLLRVHPPFRLASVLGSSWVHHLEFSLRRRVRWLFRAFRRSPQSGSPSLIEATGSHVPHKSLSWDRAAFMPVTTRAVSRRPPSFVTGQRLEPAFDDVPTLSTRPQRFTHVRLPSSHLTGSSRLFRLAHHPGRWARAASGGLDPGPATRVRGALPHLLCSRRRSVGHHGLPSAPSWRTVVRVPCEAVPPALQLLVQLV